MVETEDLEQYRSLIQEIPLFSYLTDDELGDFLSRVEILHSVINLNDLDSLVQDFMEES